MSQQIQQLAEEKQRLANVMSTKIRLLDKDHSDQLQKKEIQIERLMAQVLELQKI